MKFGAPPEVIGSPSLPRMIPEGSKIAPSAVSTPSTCLTSSRIDASIAGTVPSSLVMSSLGETTTSTFS